MVLLALHLKSLQLPTILAECEKVTVRYAADNVDRLAFLLQLCELELPDCERQAADRRLNAAHFPSHKTLDTFKCHGARHRGLRTRQARPLLPRLRIDHSTDGKPRGA